MVRSILGLTPFSGNIDIHWDDKPNVGYVPQKAMFEPSLPLTVMDFVLLNQTRIPLFWRRKTKQHQKAIDILAQVGMERRSDLRMGQVSGGEQQRVLFAQAMLDNPTTYSRRAYYGNG
ncbi:ABC transporter in pyoverdin gene cluster ATP-binding component [Vibrio maritimus]|uniref:ABC transporter in pyoverdin gene cluster ATP-binding component n=1 Tax=Vibrio maritimus TaxID=990268 RepID=A0A090SDB0_9VIBR|nr:ABC transporter in pyoverdin gene cluster ATP-binding component [Vibrio maritimus]